jgi:hypothetical protein
MTFLRTGPIATDCTDRGVNGENPEKTGGGGKRKRPQSFPVAALGTGFTSAALNH